LEDDFILFRGITKIIKMLSGIKKDGEVTENEVRLMVDAVAESGTIDESEMAMIHNVFKFDDKTAEDIATHRTDIEAISSDASEEDVMSITSEVKYSRLPVYEDSIDNIVGILHIKDLLKYILKKGRGEFQLKVIMRKPYFVPLSKKLDELFEEMQKNKQHMAIVVDEYGGTIGLVTMEDIIEEIMGNIWDEYDEEEGPDIQEIDINTYRMNGTANLDDVAEVLGVNLPEDDYDTLGGFIIGQLGRIPAEEEQPEIEFNGLVFKVKRMDEKRIDSVIVCKSE